MTDSNHTPPTPHETSREPVPLGAALTETLNELDALRSSRIPTGISLSVPLSKHGELLLGDLRGLMQMADRLPDSALVVAYQSMDPAAPGRLTVGDQEVLTWP